MSAAASRTSSPPVRQPYHGSCHCGQLRYVVFISLPPAAFSPGALRTPSVYFYKCNCTVCHKMAICHTRVPDPPQDFYLLSPLDLGSLSDYQCGKKKNHWYFCSNCGVHCFALRSEGEIVEVDLEAALGKQSEGKMTKVWRCKEDEWNKDGRRDYLSINAHTIEAGQEGFDMRELVDKKWLAYMDCKDFKEDLSIKYPQEGGTW